jgi:SAM-dependent methyltransferase
MSGGPRRHEGGEVSTKEGETIEAHNRQQRDYFEAGTKPTMVPTDTLYVRRQVDELLAVADLAPDARVLEIGCGMGRYTLPLLDRGISVEGLDLSKVLLERLAAYGDGRYDVTLHCADVADPPPELLGRFDAVVGFFMLHHLHDISLSFRGIARMLAPGGVAVFLEPNAFNPLYYLQIAITPRMTWAGDKGIVKMRRGLIGRAMKEAGFEKFEVERFGFFPPFVANRPWGAALERRLERVSIWRPLLPFQIFKGTRV